MQERAIKVIVMGKLTMVDNTKRWPLENNILGGFIEVGEIIERA